jgi:pilus assembly protein Flp/PilA
MEIMKRLIAEEEGQGLVEYVLIIAVISVLGLAAGPAVVTAITNKFNAISTTMGTPPAP